MQGQSTPTGYWGSGVLQCLLSPLPAGPSAGQHPHPKPEPLLHARPQLWCPGSAGTVCILQGGCIPPSFPLGLLQPLQIDCRKAGTCRAPQVEGCGSQWLLLPSTSGSLPATSGAMAEQMSKAAACLSSCLLPHKVSSQARWSSSICSIFSF